MCRKVEETMLKEILFNQPSMMILGKMLDNAAVNQRVIAANVANVSTPGYRKRGVNFDEQLKRAVNSLSSKILRSEPGHLPQPDSLQDITPEVVYVENGYWNGINNVNIDQEMADLAKNQLDFNIAAKLLNEKFNGLRTAIRGRR
jgi:flagellar basal-body rod protein FlgB